jgi:hypothetical protein
MRLVPIIAAPSQTVQAILGGQSCRLEIYQKSTGLFINVYVNDALIIGGVVCENENRIVRSLYLGFIGDLAFFDTAGDADPEYRGLGSRWLLLYLTPEDIAEPTFDVEAFIPVPSPPYILQQTGGQLLTEGGGPIIQEG